MIYIIDSDPTKCAQALDDKSLNVMIRDIAQVLCNVHYIYEAYDMLYDVSKVPLKVKTKTILAEDQWSQWARECVANYKYLVELGLALCVEFSRRSDRLADSKDGDADFDIHPLNKTIRWARDNVPDLPIPIGSMVIDTNNVAHTIRTPFPLVMPKKYILSIPYNNGKEVMAHIDNGTTEWDTVSSYRNYYQAKLTIRMAKVDNKIVWTNREKPQWIHL
jgi:hypothetical protein